MGFSEEGLSDRLSPMTFSGIILPSLIKKPKVKLLLGEKETFKLIKTDSLPKMSPENISQDGLANSFFNCSTSSLAEY